MHMCMSLSVHAPAYTHTHTYYVHACALSHTHTYAHTHTHTHTSHRVSVLPPDFLGLFDTLEGTELFHRLLKGSSCRKQSNNSYINCHPRSTHQTKQIHKYHVTLDLDHVALRPQKRGCLLGTGTGRESEGSTKDTARKRPERPWTAARTMEVLRRCPLDIAQRLVHCFNCRAGQSHKDNVRCTAVEEQPEAKEVQLSQPSSTSLLMISSGLT